MGYLLIEADRACDKIPFIRLLTAKIGKWLKDFYQNTSFNPSVHVYRAYIVKKYSENPSLDKLNKAAIARLHPNSEFIRINRELDALFSKLGPLNESQYELGIKQQKLEEKKQNGDEVGSELNGINDRLVDLAALIEPLQNEIRTLQKRLLLLEKATNQA